MIGPQCTVWTTVSHILSHVSRSPAGAECDPGPERLVVEPGCALVNLHTGVQQYHPLCETRNTRATDRLVLAVVGYWAALPNASDNTDAS